MFYKETYLSFGLSIALFIFNLFGEGLYWLLNAFLHWVLCHYLDNFIAIFSAFEASPSGMRFGAKVYIWLKNLGIPRSNSKNQMGTKLSLFWNQSGHGKAYCQIAQRQVRTRYSENRKGAGRQFSQPAGHSVSSRFPVFMLSGCTAGKSIYEETMGFCQSFS